VGTFDPPNTYTWSILAIVIAGAPGSKPGDEGPTRILPLVVARAT
jgi:hypothetical protein